MELKPDTRNILFRTLRACADMSLKDVATEYAGYGYSISVSDLSDYERGRKLLSTSQQTRLAKVLAENLRADK